jgi:hypothetical protein
MLESTSSSTDQETKEEDISFSDQIRAGIAYRVIELITIGYKKMYDNGRYRLEWKENKFNAVLKGYIGKECRTFSRRTGMQWDLNRENYHDSGDVVDGDGDPDKVPRIDIVILTWLDYEKIIFPFECKLIRADNTTLIRLYIQKGLKDRYLTAKDYASGSPWGGMIGYVLAGGHEEIAEKLNVQIDKQLKDPNAHLKIQSPINDFDAIYVSSHQYPNTAMSLAITHLLLSFFPGLDKTSI